eukprot:971870-Amphidinium_carterae.2
MGRKDPSSRNVTTPTPSSPSSSTSASSPMPVSTIVSPHPRPTTSTSTSTPALAHITLYFHTERHQCRPTHSAAWNDCGVVPPPPWKSERVDRPSGQSPEITSRPTPSTSASTPSGPSTSPPTYTSSAPERLPPHR